MLISVLVLAAGVALLGGLALIGTGGVTKPPSAVLEFMVLPLIGGYAFVTLASLSGGGRGVARRPMTARTACPVRRRVE